MTYFPGCRLDVPAFCRAPAKRSGKSLIKLKLRAVYVIAKFNQFKHYIAIVLETRNQ